MHLTSHSPEETRQVGNLLGQRAQPGDLFLLTGPLGAGKTCLTQGLAWGLGVEGYARSPTFVIITRYRGRLTLHHVDLFRIGSAEEAWDLGLEEYLSGDGVCVVEWADRFPELFPRESTWIALEYGAGESDRLLTIEAETERYERLVGGLHRTVETEPRGPAGQAAG